MKTSDGYEVLYLKSSPKIAYINSKPYPLKHRNCPNCGAPANPHKEKCEYCETYYNSR